MSKKNNSIFNLVKKISPEYLNMIPIGFFSFILIFSTGMLLNPQTYRPIKNDFSVRLPSGHKLNIPPIPATASYILVKHDATPSSTIVNYGRSLKIPILTYHYIGNNPNPGKDPMRDNLSVPPDIFEDQMKYLKMNGYNTITLDTMCAALKGQTNLPTKSVILTFDDGYVDFFVNAYPILRKYNLQATAFIPTQLIGTGYYLNWEQIKEMSRSGLVSFEAHSLTHPTLTAIDPVKAEQEITLSKKELESVVGVPVNFFCYPYGISNSYIEQLVQKAGYVGGLGTWNGNIVSEGMIFNMPRIKVSGSYSINEFERIAS